MRRGSDDAEEPARALASADSLDVVLDKACPRIDQPTRQLAAGCSDQKRDDLPFDVRLGRISPGALGKSLPARDRGGGEDLRDARGKRPSLRPAAVGMVPDRGSRRRGGRVPGAPTQCPHRLASSFSLPPSRAAVNPTGTRLRASTARRLRGSPVGTRPLRVARILRAAECGATLGCRFRARPQGERSGLRIDVVVLAGHHSGREQSACGQGEHECHRHEAPARPDKPISPRARPRAGARRQSSLQLHRPRQGVEVDRRLESCGLDEPRALDSRQLWVDQYEFRADRLAIRSRDQSLHAHGIDAFPPTL
jgi:hypothetical protein